MLKVARPVVGRHGQEGDKNEGSNELTARAMLFVDDLELVRVGPNAQSKRARCETP
jgi:hypothetical protein